MPKHDHLRSLPIVEHYPSDVWDAINYAATAHEQQIRKISGNHYIVHPFGVLEIVRQVTSDFATQQAAVLHDTVEDTTVTLEDLEREFGKEVARIVWGVTKDDTITDWRECNQAYLARLANEAPEKSVVVALADKIHNITDQIENFIRYGEDMWLNFAAQPDDQLWWFSSVLAIGVERTPDSPLVGQLADLIELFRTKVMGRTAMQGPMQ